MPVQSKAAWSEFLDEVERIRKKLGFKHAEECFYRGHSNASYLLLPGLYRGVKKHVKRISDELWYNESDLFYEFRSKATSLHKQQVSDWDILFFMQHHGVRTRLLDWTDSLGVAVYFALLNCNPASGSPCIWIMNPYRFNEVFHHTRDLWDPQLLNFYKNYNKEGNSYSEFMLYENNGKIIPWDKPVALYPLRKAERLSTQSGYFTIHGNDSRPIETIVGKRQGLLYRVHIPKNAISGAVSFLESAGINQFSLFPDLDGLSKYLNKKYFLT
ncbi:MAG TPA: FRG domain-containing protein [Lacibacter sp.]|nr:FRG domain-containing protein [Lacibacter sp.]